MSKKNYGISLARLLATISIVACHVYQYYDNSLAWWFNVGVDVFLIISGYLYGKRQIKFKDAKDWVRFSVHFYYKEFIKLFIPLFIHLLICLLVYYFKGEIVDKYYYLFLLKNPGISGFGYMWFFKYIIICYIFVPFYYLLPNFKIKRICLALLFVVLFLIKLDYVWLCCFLLGAFISTFEDNKARLFINGTIYFVGIISFIYCLMNNVDRTNLNFMLNIQKISMGACIVLLCLIFIPKYGFSRRLFDSSDKNSYGLFLIHPLFLQGALSIMTTFSVPFYNIALYILVIIAYVFPFNELGRRIINKAMLLPKYIEKRINPRLEVMDNNESKKCG